MVKKEFFRVPSAKEIMSYDSVREIDSNLIDEVCGLRNFEGCVIGVDLIPGGGGSVDFMINGPKVVVSDVSEINRNSIGRRARSGYVVKRKRYSLYENLEGDRIVGYCRDAGFDFEEKIVPCYRGRDESLVVKIPSRVEERKDYDVLFKYVRDGDRVRDVRSAHFCKTKKFRGNVGCAHEFAAYMLLMDYYGYGLEWREASNFFVPDEKLVRFYRKINHNCLVKTSLDDKPRGLYVAEKEIFAWGFLQKILFPEK